MEDIHKNISKHRHMIVILYISFLAAILFFLIQIPRRDTSLSASATYYNHGTQKTLSAYQQALWSGFSGLQNAKHLIAEAQDDFDIADKIKLNNALDAYIQANASLSQKLDVVIQVKACYSTFQTSIDALWSFDQQLQDAQNILEQEAKAIQQDDTLWENCRQDLENINTISQNQLGQLQKATQKYQKQYTQNLAANLQSPANCLDTAMTDIQPMIDESKKGIQDFAQTHQNPDLSSLCDQAKDDSQVNEQMENSLNKLFDQLQQNLEPSDTPKSWDKKQNTDIEYKDVFEDQERKLLEEIDDNNRMLIRQIQEIKSKWSYSAPKLLNKLFEEFYGNMDDFKNPTAPATDTKW